jgi:hypothetical protein
MSNIQSSSKPKIFAKITNKNNPQVKNTIFPEKSFSHMNSSLNFLMVEIVHIQILFRVLEFFFRALLNNITIITKIIINIQVEKTVFEIST